MIDNYVVSLLVISGKYISNKEKAFIFAWRQKNSPIKVICS